MLDEIKQRRRYWIPISRVAGDQIFLYNPGAYTETFVQNRLRSWQQLRSQSPGTSTWQRVSPHLAVLRQNRAMSSLLETGQPYNETRAAFLPRHIHRECLRLQALLTRYNNDEAWLFMHTAISVLSLGTLGATGAGHLAQTAHQASHLVGVSRGGYAAISLPSAVANAQNANTQSGHLRASAATVGSAAGVLGAGTLIVDLLFFGGTATMLSSIGAACGFVGGMSNAFQYSVNMGQIQETVERMVDLGCISGAATTFTPTAQPEGGRCVFTDGTVRDLRPRGL